MRRLLRVGTSCPEATASALKISAKIPASGITFVDNSRGASAATAELSAALDRAIDQVDLSGDLDAQLRDVLLRLDREASKYANSRVDENRCAEWTCSQSAAHVVSAAWKCALGAYDVDAMAKLPDSPYYKFEQDHVVSPSFGGSTKGLLSAIVTPAEGTNNELLPALIIAVRGSASKLDHMVNANSRPRRAFDYNGLSVDAHDGFLNSAEALEKIVSERIRLYVQRTRPNAHVIFTGHSAGGAVASLLFLRRLVGSDNASDVKLSCITFGAPPVVTQALDVKGLVPHRSLGLCLNVINEFDVVSRADGPYIMCLVNLTRSLFGQPPIPDSGVELTRGVDPSGSNTSQQAAGSENVWPVPAPMYHHVGSLVLLLTRLDDDGRICLKAREVTEEALQQLLFCRVEVHSRACYSDRIRRLEEGELSA